MNAMFDEQDIRRLGGDYVASISEIDESDEFDLE
jgi:hypothetical protein